MQATKLKLKSTLETSEKISPERVQDLIQDLLKNIGKLSAWVRGFSAANAIEDSIERSIVRYNTRNFIRSLYMGLSHLGHKSDLMGDLMQVEKSLNLFSKMYP